MRDYRQHKKIARCNIYSTAIKRRITTNEKASSEKDGFLVVNGCTYIRNAAGDDDTSSRYRLGRNLVDTSWHTGTEREYSIDTAAGLAGLAKLINEDHEPLGGITITLQNDIDLKNNEWKPIGFGHVTEEGKVLYAFDGIFDGNGYTVTNLKNEVNYATSGMPYSSDPSDMYIFGAAGLFGFVDTDAVIKNLAVDGNINVTHLNNTIHQGNAGGIVGYNSGTMINCVNKASVEGQYATGGIAGFNDGGTIQKCMNQGTISAYTEGGGIVGETDGGEVSQCINGGSVSSAENHPYLGGIIGSTTEGASQAQVSNCLNLGSVAPGSTSNYGQKGGITGGTYHCDIVNCVNIGTITGADTSSTGAIAGDLGSNAYDSSVFRSYFLDSSYSKGIGTSSANSPSAVTRMTLLLQSFILSLRRMVLW